MITLAQRVRQLPKVELHLHLDGSMPGRLIADIAKARGIRLPCAPGELSAWARKRDRSSMASSLKVFDFMNQFLQTEYELEAAANEVCNTLAAEGVVHAEIRFCPALHTKEGLTPYQAVTSVRRGIETSTLPRSPIIVSALRNLSPEHSLEMAQLALDTGAKGFDIAGNEEEYPLHLHAEALEFARDNGITLVPHAGESANSEENIRFALDVGAKRIGHALALRNDEELMERVAAEGVIIECCPTANVGSRRAVSFAQHPMPKYFKAGIKTTINSDNLTVSGSLTTGAPSPTQEALRVVKDMQFNWQEWEQCVNYAVEGALLDEDDRETLHATVQAKIQEVLGTT